MRRSVLQDIRQRISVSLFLASLIKSVPATCPYLHHVRTCIMSKPASCQNLHHVKTCCVSTFKICQHIPRHSHHRHASTYRCIHTTGTPAHTAASHHKHAGTHRGIHTYSTSAKCPLLLLKVFTPHRYATIVKIQKYAVRSGCSQKPLW